jgi:hypothetical protein
MLSKVFLALLIAVCIIGGLYYKFSQDTIKDLRQEILNQQALLQAQELRQQEQIKTIEALQTNMARTTEALKVQTKKNSEIEAEKERYLAIFARHDLSKLAAAKPGLLEPRFNKGTKNVFESIEKDSADIDSIDN